jgi:MFS transporter, PPP family, 3-phenylpropionic acid transporter
LDPARSAHPGTLPGLRSVLQSNDSQLGKVRLTPRYDRMLNFRAALPRFVVLYAGLYGAFGLASPFFPAFLESRGLQPEQLGILLGLATAVRLVSGTLVGRLADFLHALRAELALCALFAAVAALLYLPFHTFGTLVLIALFQAAALAPLTILSDALALGAVRTAQTSAGGRFEYGWVGGAGSAAFIAGVLLSGQATSRFGLSAIIWLSAAFLFVTAAVAGLVPDLKRERMAGPNETGLFTGAILLLQQQAFLRITIVAVLVLGSHALHDSFAVIRWTRAGITPSMIGLLWAESVVAEVFVFVLLGPRLLGLLGPAGALAAAAIAGMLRWGVMAQTTDEIALAFVQPLHGLTFALLQLACMRVIGDTVPRYLAATAQAIYSSGIGGATALVTMSSGWLYAYLGPAGAFWTMAGVCAAALPVISLVRRSLRPIAGADERRA